MPEHLRELLAFRKRCLSKRFYITANEIFNSVALHAHEVVMVDGGSELVVRVGVLKVNLPHNSGFLQRF
jgi:hypothetical protein